MENKDFRSRLKNRKTPYNPEAWNQMAEFLDAMPTEIKEEKKKKRWGWLFFFGILLIGLSIFGITTHFLTSADNQVLTTNSEKEVKKENSRILENKENLSQQIKSEKSNIIKLNQEEKLSKNTDLTTTSNLTKITPSIIENKIINEKEISLVNSQEQTQVISTTDETNDPNPLPQTKEIVGTTNLVSELEAFSSKQKLETQPNSTVKDDVSSDLSLKSESVDGDYSKLSNLLSIIDDSLMQKNKAYLERNASDIIRVPKNKRLYLNGMIGPAWFNGVSGYHVSTGIFWDINKLFGLETNLAYSIGSDKTIRIEDTFQKERQIDLNLLLHLNLYRSFHHKISIELGGGFTDYQGNRIIGPSQPTDVRKSKGLNLQGGLSYTYFIRKHGIGFKMGTISYDDSVNYAAIKYMYKF